MTSLQSRYIARAPFFTYAELEALVKSTGQDHAKRGHKCVDYEHKKPA